MFITRHTLVLLFSVGLLTAACGIEAQRKQEDEENMKRFQLHINECARSQGLVEGQPITKEQRTELMWCAKVLWAKEEKSKGSTDVDVRFVTYLANCDAIVGKDWGDAGSKKRNRLISCINMQAEKDIKLDSAERALLFQQLQNLNQQKSIINCYTYGNWTQCE